MNGICTISQLVLRRFLIGNPYPEGLYLSLQRFRLLLHLMNLLL